METLTVWEAIGLILACALLAYSIVKFDRHKADKRRAQIESERHRLKLLDATREIARAQAKNVNSPVTRTPKKRYSGGSHASNSSGQSSGIVGNNANVVLMDEYESPAPRSFQSDSSSHSWGGSSCDSGSSSSSSSSSSSCSFD